MAAFAAAPVANASLFSYFVVFGDSLSDDGNAYIATSGATPAAPNYEPGVFTDGPLTIPAGTAGGIWNQDLAAMLGVPVAQPFLAGGTNYAVGGAEVLNNVPYSPTLTIPSLSSQVGLYLTSTGGVANPNALYVIWGGANDLYSALETPGETAAEIAATETAMASSLEGDIEALAAAGAKDFLWLDLPQLATTPRGALDLMSTPSLATAFSDASQQFATDVSTDSALLDNALGVKIADVDIYGLYQAILADPAAYGYTNVTGYAQGNAGVNPNQYLFWDLDSHPTTTGEALIADAAYNSVQTTFAPEPATWTMAGSGLLLMALWRRRRAN